MSFVEYSKESAHRAYLERQARLGAPPRRPIIIPPRTVPVMTKMDKVKASVAPMMRVPRLDELPDADSASGNLFAAALARIIHEAQKKRHDVLPAEEIAGMIESGLRKHMEPHRRSLSVEAVQKVVAARYALTQQELVAKRRDAETVIPRWIAFYLAKRLTRKSYVAIGKSFAGCDHSTVIRGIKQIEERLNADDRWLQKELDFLTMALAQAGGVKK